MWGRLADRQPILAKTASIMLGAIVLVWPALVNQYPIVFSDTHAFLVQAGEPMMVWDKPWFYGPFLRIWHANTTLWLPLMAQGLIVSHLLWLTRAAFAPPRAGYHVGLCAALALGSAAPWFTALLMPDIFAPVAVLCLFLLGCPARLSRGAQVWVGCLGGFAITTHLAFLPLAAAVIAVVLLMRGRAVMLAPLAGAVVLAPLAGALALLVVSNAIGHGKPGISPYGAVFALARLVTDGPAQAVLARECPQAGWRMCDWRGRFPADSDNFLWDGDGPVWSTPGGPQALAAEASAIVARTLASEPLAVLAGALANAARQFAMVRLGDTLAPTWLEVSITGSLRAYFPPDEMARFRAGRQMNDRLRPIGEAFNLVHMLLLVAGGVASLVVLVQALRHRRRTQALFGAVVLVAVLANAVASGALSRPNDRYQARIVWLVLLVPLLAIGPRYDSTQRAARAMTPGSALPAL